MIKKIKINFYPLNAKLQRFVDFLINLFDEGIMVFKIMQLKNIHR